MGKRFSTSSLTFIVALVLLAACAKQTPPPTITPTPSPLFTFPPPLVVTAVPDGYVGPSPYPSSTLPAYPPAILSLTVPPPTPTVGPSPTPWPTETPYPTEAPSTTPLPTLEPTALLYVLPTTLRLESKSSVDARSLHKITNWAYGFRPARYCDGAYRWLTDQHLMLFPVVGEDKGDLWHPFYTLAIVSNLNTGQSWIPMGEMTTAECDTPLWSVTLQAIISSMDSQQVWMFDIEGHPLQSRPGQGPLSLSPSGKRLLVGSMWLDLETQTSILLTPSPPLQFSFNSANFAWSSDERRIFTCCFAYMDVDTQQAGFFDPHLALPGRDGPPAWTPDLFHSDWVLNDSRVMVQYDFESETGYGVIPLIDPATQTFQDIRELIGLPLTRYCGVPYLSPDKNHFVILCGKPWPDPATGTTENYVVDLGAFTTQTLPADYQFVNWSPNSQHLLLLPNDSTWSPTAKYALWDIASATYEAVASVLIRAPAWSPSGSHLAYLTEDGKSLITLKVANRASHIVLLPQPFTSALWHPSGTGLALLAADGSLWWVPDFTTDYAEQLTSQRSGRSSPRDLRWSPSGTHLAFVSGPDIYIVTVNQ